MAVCLCVNIWLVLVGDMLDKSTPATQQAMAQRAMYEAEDAVSEWQGACRSLLSLPTTACAHCVTRATASCLFTAGLEPMRCAQVLSSRS